MHAYASLTNGKQVFIGNSTFKVVGPSADVTIKIIVLKKVELLM